MSSAEERKFELYEGLPRQGPGCAEATRRAFKMLPIAAGRPDILDIGCGSGAQTVELALCSGGRVTAVDIHEPFLRALEESAREAWLEDRIQTRAMSMELLDFPDGTFDLLWSEGAVYNMGFEKGLRAWRRLLRPGGCAAVSELTWLNAYPPEAARSFWSTAYPAMGEISENLDRARRAGYEPLDTFTLPESAWWDEYYTPQLAKLATLERRYPKDSVLIALIAGVRAEIELYRRHSAAYGYVFYLLRRAAD